MCIHAHVLLLMNVNVSLIYTCSDIKVLVSYAPRCQYRVRIFFITFMLAREQRIQFLCVQNYKSNLEKFS